MHSVCHVATPTDEGKRLDMLLADLALYPSRSAAARAIGEERVRVDGASVPKSHIVAAGEAVVCDLDDQDDDLPVAGQPIDLDIRFEDDDVIVLSKQAGLVCHPSVDHPSGTLVNALIFHCGADHLCNVQGDDDRLGIVHRLDADTSGLMLAAKTDAAGLALMDDIRARAVDRRYLALVCGVISHDTGMIDAPIMRSPHERTRMAVRDDPAAREAITTFRVLERFEPALRDDGYTLVECKLFTGRTHQIRVHMQYVNHSVAGDPVYRSHGSHGGADRLGLDRQFLHSHSLEFTHPITGVRLSFVDGLPQDLARALDQLAPRSLGKTQAGREVEDLVRREDHATAEEVSA